MNRSHLFILFLGLLLLSRWNNLEGFNKSGGYDYLKPIPSPPPEIDNTLALKFMTLLTKNGNKYLVKPVDESNINITNVNKTYTLEEINYYIKNNKFPYDTYIIDYLNKNRTIIKDQKSTIFKVPFTLDMLQEIWSTRLIYLVFIQGKEIALNPNPLSYEIYAGTKPYS